MSDLRMEYRSFTQQLPNYLWLFPLTTGLSWLTTLSILLIYWIAIGCPTFPEQSNPYIPFISDIAAWHLKPVFTVGCTITSIAFVGTVFSVHHARRSPQFYGFPGFQSRWRQVTSVVALVAGVVAGVSLFFLALFDTVRAHSQHRILLLSVFGGLGITAIATSLVWSDVWISPGTYSGKRRERNGATRRTRRLKIWCIINFVLVVVIAVLGAVFTAGLYTNHMRTAGIIEWVITYVGCFWLLSFVRFFIRSKEEEQHEDGDDGFASNTERRPLLRDQWQRQSRQ